MFPYYEPPELDRLLRLLAQDDPPPERRHRPTAKTVLLALAIVAICAGTTAVSHTPHRCSSHWERSWQSACLPTSDADSDHPPRRVEPPGPQPRSR